MAVLALTVAFFVVLMALPVLTHVAAVAGRPVLRVGACALVYQVMWLRLLSLVFGATVYAASNRAGRIHGRPRRRRHAWRRRASRSPVPFTISQRAYEARRAGFEQFQWDLPTLTRIYSAGPDEIREFLGDGPILTDDKPVIEYFLSLPKNDAPGGYRGRSGSFEALLRP